MKEGILRFKIGFCHLTEWFVVNVIFATLLLWASKYSPFYQDRHFFSSFLAYAFTFLIVSLYVFIIVRQRLYSQERLTVFSILIITVIVAGVYLILNYSAVFVEIIKSHLLRSVIILLFISTVCGGILHWPDLRDHINKEFSDKKKESAEKLRKKVQDMKGDVS